MIDEASKARDEHLISAFAVVLTAGFNVDRAEHGLFIQHYGADFVVVKAEIVDGSVKFAEERFDDVRAAVGYYLDLIDEIEPE
jgi:hypothetical protein